MIVTTGCQLSWLSQQPYVVQFLNEVTDSQSGEVAYPRSHNKEMAKSGLELWVLLPLEPMLLVTLTTTAASLLNGYYVWGTTVSVLYGSVI